MRPQKRVKDIAYLLFVEEVVGIVEADEQHGIFVGENFADLIEEILEGRSRCRRGSFREFFVDLRKNCELCIVYLTVYVDGDYLLCLLFDVGEEHLYRCGLSRARESLADCVERSCPRKSRFDVYCEFPYLTVAKIELLGHVVYLEYLNVAKESLIPHEQVFFHEEFYELYCN